MFSIDRIFSQLVHQRRILTTAVVTRRPWNWCCIIGMKAQVLDRVCLNRWDRRSLANWWGPANPIQREPERFAKGGQGPFGGISFRGLKRNVVHLTVTHLGLHLS